LSQTKSNTKTDKYSDVYLVTAHLSFPKRKSLLYTTSTPVATLETMLQRDLKLSFYAVHKYVKAAYVHPAV